jgi:hypothetical protein
VLAEFEKLAWQMDYTSEEAVTMADVKKILSKYFK